MQERAPQPPAPVRSILPRHVLREEIWVVLSLSLLSSAVFAVIDLLRAPLHGVAVSTFPSFEFADQLTQIVFALAPVWLVVHLLRRTGEGPGAIGLALAR